MTKELAAYEKEARETACEHSWRFMNAISVTPDEKELTFYCVHCLKTTKTSLSS